MINKVILVGRLTRDPQPRKTSNGKSVTSFTVACDRKTKVEGQPTADFINCVAWNKVADVVAQYTHKGSLVGVEGRIQTRSYDDQGGNKVFVTEVLADGVQFLEPKGTSQPQSMNQQGYVPEVAQTNSNYAQTQGYAQPTYQPQGYTQPTYQPPTYSQPSSNWPQYDGSSDYANSRLEVDIASDDLPF